MGTIMGTNVSMMRGEPSKTVLREMCNDLHLKGKIVVEVGSYAGESTVIFSEFCKTIYAIDPWLEGMSLADGTTKGESLLMHPDVEKEFDKRTGNISNIVKKKGFDYDVIDEFEDESLDFVYIDALHTEEEMKRQINAWLPKIKSDGTLGGHDFCEHFAGIKKAVLETLGTPDKIYNDAGNSWIKRKSAIMPLHFILTGKDFKYLYYISILSGIKAHNVYETILWMTEDVESEYLDLLRDKITIKKLDVPVFPALIGKPDYFVLAHTKDYFTYKILYENGGICLDLDTISIGDITSLLGDKDLVAASDMEISEETPTYYNSAILVAKKGSPLLLEALKSATKVLNQTEYSRWGMTGPLLITDIVSKHIKKVFVPEFRVCGGTNGYEIAEVYKEVSNFVLDPKVKVLHLCAVAINKIGNLFNNTNPTLIKKSNSLVVKIIRNLLSEKEWDTDKKFFVEIGSNYFNTLVDFAKDGWKGLIIEPVPEYFDKIERVTGVIYENVAIGKETKVVDFYHIPEEVIVKENLPDWARGLGSLEKAHPIVIKNNWQAYLWISQVQMMTVADILKKHNITNIDYLKIDTEGYDCKILSDFDITSIPEILFEHKHCSKDEIEKQLERLNNNNFYYMIEGDNVRARKKNSVLLSSTGKTKFRFHMLGYVHLPCSKDFFACAFTAKNYNMSQMLLDLGHEVYYYGAEGSTVPCTEFIQTHTLGEIASTWGDGDNTSLIGYSYKDSQFRHDFNGTKTPLTLKFYDKCVEEINKRKRPDDFLMIGQGYYHKPIADKVELYKNVEFGIGYRGSVKGYFRGFESSYIQNFTYGNADPFKSINGAYYDRVFGNYFNPDDFEFSDTHDDYYLYLGRMIQRKGVMTAVKATQAIGAKLILAGQKDPEINEKTLPSNCEFIGHVNIEQRKELMSKAIATFTPTIYLEPFCGVHCESMLSGVPPITTNFGVFPETIPDYFNNKVGFRCNTLQDFIDAALRARDFTKEERTFVRTYGEKFLTTNVMWNYERWFQDIHQLYLSTLNSNIKGWHNISDKIPEWKRHM